MKFSTYAALGLAQFASLASCAAIPDDSSPDGSSSGCKEVSFTVNGTAINLELSTSALLGNLTAILGSTVQDILTAIDITGSIEVTGTETIAATYCPATVKNANNGKLQVLFSSITANRGQWQAMGGLGTKYPEYQPGNYSWTARANAQGYPTLALDRLGSGKSSHPDPLLYVQAPYEISLYNELANQIRAGSAALPSAFNYLIYVGNSYGSQLGASIAGQHPAAYDEYILTGFTNDVQQDFVGLLLVAPLPADLVDPADFGTLPIGYVTTSSEAGRTGSFFGTPTVTSYDPAIPPLFYQRKDVVSLGQFLSIYVYPFNGKGFTGRVLVLNGQNDWAFCGPGNPLLGPADCTPDRAGTAALFPDADFNWHLVPKSAHAIPLFLSYTEIFSTAFSFLAGASYKT